jgi:choline dehydrogenase-like flavoprotein
MLRPESRGYIALKTLDPKVQPIIQPNYFATQKDRDTMIKGVKMSREIILHMILICIFLKQTQNNFDFHIQVYVKIIEK